MATNCASIFNKTDIFPRELFLNTNLITKTKSYGQSGVYATRLSFLAPCIFFSINIFKFSKKNKSDSEGMSKKLIMHLKKHLS